MTVAEVMAKIKRVEEIARGWETKVDNHDNMSGLDLLYDETAEYLWDYVEMLKGLKVRE